MLASLYEQFGYIDAYELMCDLCKDVTIYGKLIMELDLPINNKREHLDLSLRLYVWEDHTYVITKVNGKYQALDHYEDINVAMDYMRQWVEEV